MSWISELWGRKDKRAQTGGYMDAPVVSIAERNPPKPHKTDPLPRFRSTARDQLLLAGSDKLARIRLRLRNAYTPAQPVTDP